MRKLTILMTLVLFTAGVSAAPLEVEKIPKLEFDPPVAERVVLSNGIVVYLMEDHELPLFSLGLNMRLGYADGPPGLNLVSSFFGGLWRAGGTQSRTPDDLNEELEFIPANVETGAGEEAASISMSCMSGDIDKTFDIFIDVLFNPRFDPKQLSLAKDKQLEGLRRKNDTDVSISRRAIRDIVYGPDYVYAWDAKKEDIKKVKRAHLLAFHKKVVAPDGAILTMSGDFDKKVMIEKLETAFKNWKPTGRKVAKFDYEIKAPMPGSRYFVQKDSTQSRIYFARAGVSRHNEDLFTLAVGNYILGGGGPSRLFAEIRSRLGLAYAIGSFYTDPLGPGLIGVAVQTKAPTTVQTIQAIEKELDKFSSTQPSEEEMGMAKDAILNAFVFRFDSIRTIVNETAGLEYYGYPEDYLKTYPDKIRNVTAADVLRIGKKYYQKDGRKVLVVGDQKKFDDALDLIGGFVDIPLENID